MSFIIAEENEIEETLYDPEINAENIKKFREIFDMAGAAFSKLGALIMQLQPNNESSVGSRIRTTLKKKTFEVTELPVTQIQTVAVLQENQQAQIMQKSADLALNEPESEVEDVILKFDGATEEVKS